MIDVMCNQKCRFSVGGGCEERCHRQEEQKWPVTVSPLGHAVALQTPDFPARFPSPLLGVEHLRPHRMDPGVPSQWPLTALFSACLLLYTQTTSQLSLGPTSHTSKPPFLSTSPQAVLNSCFSVVSSLHQVLVALPFHLQDKNLNSLVNSQGLPLKSD